MNKLGLPHNFNFMFDYVITDLTLQRNCTTIIFMLKPSSYENYVWRGQTFACASYVFDKISFHKPQDIENALVVDIYVCLCVLSYVCSCPSTVKASSPWEGIGDIHQ